jgi:hypothetical protein
VVAGGQQHANNSLSQSSPTARFIPCQERPAPETTPGSCTTNNPPSYYCCCYLPGRRPVPRQLTIHNTRARGACDRDRLRRASHTAPKINIGAGALALACCLYISILPYGQAPSYTHPYLIVRRRTGRHDRIDSKIPPACDRSNTHARRRRRRRFTTSYEDRLDYSIYPKKQLEQRDDSIG